MQGNPSGHGAQVDRDGQSEMGKRFKLPYQLLLPQGLKVVQKGIGFRLQR